MQLAFLPHIGAPSLSCAVGLASTCDRSDAAGWINSFHRCAESHSCTIKVLQLRESDLSVKCWNQRGFGHMLGAVLIVSCTPAAAAAHEQTHRKAMPLKSQSLLQKLQ
eukprot:5395027-Amphidinium_carterae.1